jgi:hypothetical protein
VALLRNAFTPLLGPRLVAHQTARERAFRVVSELAVTYREESPIVEEHPGFHGGPRPGDRAPDGPVDAAQGGGTLFQRLRGAGFHLLAFGADASLEAPQWWSGLVTTLHLAAPSPLATRYGLSEPGLYLVRPDGYVSVRVRGRDLEPVDDHLRRVLGR